MSLRKRVIAKYLKAKKDRKEDWRDSGIGRVPWIEEGWNDVVDYSFEDEETHPASKSAYKIVTDVELKGLGARLNLDVSHKEDGNLSLGVSAAPAREKGRYVLLTDVPAGAKSRKDTKRWQELENRITKDLDKASKDYSKKVEFILKRHGKVEVH